MRELAIVKTEENSLENSLSKGNVKEVIQQVRQLFPHLTKVKDEEVAKAIKLAYSLDLNPIKKEVHFVPYGNTVQLIVSYTEYIKRAERSGKLNGWKVNFGKDGIGEYADVVIYRKDWDYPFEWRVYLKEAQQNTPIWKKMPIFMLRKVAIAQAFRLAFPDETAHLPYEEAEIKTEEELISEAQKRYIIDLLADRGRDFEYIKQEFGKDLEELTKEEASKVIDHLKNLPNSPEMVEEMQKPAGVKDEEEDVPF